MEQEERICPNCGDGFSPGKRGRGPTGKRFCSPGCKKAFHNRALGEGAAVAHLVKAWMGTRHAPKGTRDAEICRTARRELTTLARLLNDRDREAGRPAASEYVAGMIAGGTIAIDRR